MVALVLKALLLTRDTVELPEATQLARALRTLRRIETTAAAAAAHTELSHALHVACSLALCAYATGTPASPRAVASEPAALEMQLRSATNGARAVLYLVRLPRRRRPLAILSVKGSTLGAPGTPPLSDWKANLAVFGGRGAYLNGCVPADVEVHSGFAGYADALISALECTSTAMLSDAQRREWRLPRGQISLWALLSSTAIDDVLLVGHSLGGACAALCATSLGAPPRGRRRRWRRRRRAPLLVTFGAPVVGNAAYRRLQESVVAPRGGVRCINAYDIVTNVGYGGVSLGAGECVHAAGVVVRLRNPWHVRWSGPHRNHLNYRCGTDAGWGTSVTVHVFPGVVYPWF